MDLLLRPRGLRKGPRCQAMEDPWVLILGDTVVSCGERPPDGLPEGIPTVRGGWLMEPLADAHVHLFLSGDLDSSEQRRTAHLPDEEAVSRILSLLEAYRRAGVAAVRDAGDPRGLALQAARVANRESGRYAALLPAGEPIFRKGRYGRFLGRGVATTAEAQQLMEENRRQGATHLKILATGINSLEEAGKVGPPQFSREEFSEVSSVARGMGLGLMVHANGPLEAAGCLLRAGCTLEHGFWISRSDVAAAAREQVPWVPTLGAWEELCGREGIDADTREVIAVTASEHRREVKEGWDLGAKVVCGTDAGSPGVSHERGLLGEIERLAEVLGGRAEALGTSSFAARRLCEQELGARLGSLEIGAPAGFLLLGGDPVLDPSVLSVPQSVYLGGVWTGTEPKK